MNNDIKVMQVFQTSEYSKFKEIKGNRSKNGLHIAKILHSMRKKLLFTVIIVNELFQIIDGQHRFEALKKLGYPVNYCICEGYDLEDVHILNQNSKNWKIDDYLNGYAENLGKDEYIKIYVLKDKYPQFGLNTLLELVNRKENSLDIVKNFKEGTYVAGDIEWAERFIESIKCFEDYFLGYSSKNFVKAYTKLYTSPKYNHNVMMKRLEQTGKTLIGCSQITQYLFILCNIYNTRTKPKDQIYFNKNGVEII